MGMFNYVKYKANCWKCGKEITEWQSKDGQCDLSEISPKEVGNFYAGCSNRINGKICGAWNEYRVIPKEIEIVLDRVESRLRTYPPNNN